MNLTPISDKAAFFGELYRTARDRQSDLYERFERAREQYKGSRRIDGSREDAVAVRNITYELIESEVSTLIPAPAVEAKRCSEHGERCAKAIERLCVALRNELPFEKLNDADERYTYIYGGSVWYVEWDDRKVSHGRVGAARVLCLDPTDFVGEPGVYDIEDMEYCFLRFRTSKNDLCRRYEVSEEALAAAATATDAEDDEVLEVIVCFWRDDEGRVCRFTFSGELTLSDERDYYARRKSVCRACHRPLALCGCEHPRPALESAEYEVLTEDLRLTDGRTIPALSPTVGADGSLRGGMRTMRQTRIPYYRPHRFPVVIRKNVSEQNALFGQSDCEFIRPQQQQINKIESRILQKLMRAGITPILPDDAEITLDNSIFGQVIRLRAGDGKERYGLLDTTPSIAQDVEQSERLYQHAKRILGISDTYMGIADKSAESGYAKRIQVEQAAGRLDSKRRMKQAAYADIDRILFSYYLAYADEPRPQSYSDAFGNRRPSVFYRYDFILYDPASGRYEYEDEFLFSVDKNGGIEQQREALWQRNLDNLQAGTLGDPSDPKTLLHYWQCQERANYPYARENVAYFRALLEAAEGEKGGNELGENPNRLY